MTQAGAAPLALPRATDVLVVGAGPTGLALSADLRRRGIDSVTIDHLPEGANTSRAAVVHARTLEVLEPLGVVPAMLAAGLQVATFRARDRDKILVSMDFARIPSAYAFTLMFPQNRTEAVLLARLRELGGEVVRSSEATALRVDTDGKRGAEVDVLRDGALHSIAARWVVGCDGMHSRVREQAGIAFEGAAYAQSFLLADVHMEWPIARQEVSLFLAPEGVMVVAPLPEDRFRIVASVDHAPEHPAGPFVQALLDQRGPQESRGRIRDAVWTSRFRVHHRVAESPRRGHVLLCGDAAHVHSPAGGQGMNTGIQDAMALGEALAAVLSGGSDARLDTWARERHEVATKVVALTDRLTRLGTVSSPLTRSLRNAAVSAAGHLPWIADALAKSIAELGDR